MSASGTRIGRFGALGRGAVAVVFLAGGTTTVVATSADLPVAAAQPSTVPTDSQGYVDSPARCAADQTAVVAGRTALSLVAICADGRGHYEYRGMRLSDGAVLNLPAAAKANGCFGARTDAVDYTVSDHKLLLSTGLRVLRDETMLEFRDYRIPAVGGSEETRRRVSEAPITQQTANRYFR